MALIRQISRRSVVLQNTTAEVSTAQTLAPYYNWVVNGELTYPAETALDGLYLNDASYTVHQVRVAARVAGDSLYNIKIVRRDLNGLNPVIVVDDLVVFSADREVYLLTIEDAEVPQHSSLEVTLFEQTVGPNPAQDLTITLIGEDFSEIRPVRNGHIIENSAGSDLPQQVNLQFTDDFVVTDDNPNNRTVVDLSALVKNTIEPIGTVVTSLLSESEFQSLKGAEWVLLDGRNISGSALASFKGWTNLPDFRGKFDRMLVDVADELVDALAVDTGADTITVAGHDYSTGFRVRLTGTVPAGTAINTDYFVIVINANTIKLASSYDNSQLGSAVDLTGAAGSFTITQWEDPDKSTRIFHESGDLGSWQDDAFQGHGHVLRHGTDGGSGSLAPAGTAGSGRTDSSGDLIDVESLAGYGTARYASETRPKNRYVNKFIKINNSV